MTIMYAYVDYDNGNARIKLTEDAIEKPQECKASIGDWVLVNSEGRLEKCEPDDWRRIGTVIAL